MQGLMNVTRTQVPKLLTQATRKAVTNPTPLLAATSVSSRNYALQKESKQEGGASAQHGDLDQVKKTIEIELQEPTWRPEGNRNPFKEQENGDLNLSDSGALGVSVDMDALKQAKDATEHWREETKEYSEESAKKANDLGTGFAETRSDWTTTLKDSATEFVAPYAAATSSLGTLASEKIGGLGEKLEKMQHRASEDTRIESEKLQHATDFVTGKYEEVKHTIAKSTSEWTGEAKHKAEDAVKHIHIKDYAAKAGEIMKEKASEVYEKVAGTVHKAKESLSSDHKKATETKPVQEEHHVSTESDLHVAQEMADEWSPAKPHEFEIPPEQKRVA